MAERFLCNMATNTTIEISDYIEKIRFKQKVKTRKDESGKGAPES